MTKVALNNEGQLIFPSVDLLIMNEKNEIVGNNTDYFQEEQTIMYHDLDIGATIILVNDGHVTKEEYWDPHNNQLKYKRKSLILNEKQLFLDPVNLKEYFNSEFYGEEYQNKASKELVVERTQTGRIGGVDGVPKPSNDHYDEAAALQNAADLHNELSAAQEPVKPMNTPPPPQLTIPQRYSSSF